MERHVDLSLLSVRTEVSDWLMYHVFHLKFPNHLMSRLYTITVEFIYNSYPAFVFQEHKWKH